MIVRRSQSQGSSPIALHGDSTTANNNNHNSHPDYTLVKSTKKDSIGSANDKSNQFCVIEVEKHPVLTSSNQIVSLETVTTIFSELQTERNWIDGEIGRVNKERGTVNSELREVEFALEELLQKKLDLEARLAKLGLHENQLRSKLEAVDSKISSIGEESFRFEKSIRTITTSSRPSHDKPSGGKLALTNDHSNSEEKAADNSINTLNGHTDTVTCLDMDLNVRAIVSGSGDKTIKLWDLTTNLVTETLQGHTGWVKCLKLRGSRLASGSGDHSIRIWNMMTGRCVSILRGHNAGVSSIQFDDERIVTGSSDRTVKSWDANSGKCTTTLDAHTEYVSCVQLYQYGLASGSGDKTIKMWDLRSGKCHRTLDAHEAGVTTLQFDMQKLISGGMDGRVKVWDLRVGTVLTEIPINAAVQDLCFDVYNIMVASAGKPIKVYDGATWDLKKFYNGHSKTVNTIRCSDSMLVSGSADHTVKVWDMKDTREPRAE